MSELIEKTCTKCQQSKPTSAFYKHKNGKNGIRSYCAECSNTYTKRYRKNNPDVIKKNESDRHARDKEKRNAYKRQYYENNPTVRREYTLKTSFGLTLDQYNLMLEGQNNVCAICGGVSKDGRALSVDHDHKCCSSDKTCGECLRSLLCNRCNLVLGSVEDNIDLLEKMMDYLRSWSKSV